MENPVSLWDALQLFWPSVLAAVVAAALCGCLGFFVVLRRVAFVAAALGQISGLGIAFGFLLGALFGHDPHQPTPLYLDPVVLALLLSGAVAASLTLLSRVQRTSPESAVAFLYLAGAALTLIVLHSPLIVQESHEVGDLLFGNSVAVRSEHLVELGVVTVLVLGSQIFLFKDLLFCSFDREMARALGLPVTALELVLHISIGVSAAVATRAVGALPVFGFLVLPSSAALLVSQSVRWVVVLSMLGAMVAAVLGFYLSFAENWPTGAMMVVVCAAYWPLAGLVRLLQRRTLAA